MENNTVLWITIAAYIICLVVIGIVEGRKAKSIADLTVGGRMQAHGFRHCLTEQLIFRL